MAHHRRLALILILALLLPLALATGEPNARQSSFRWPADPGARPIPKNEAPLELTASDGTGLRLVELTARGVLEPPLAFTELRMSFENTENRVREGRFRITLPRGGNRFREMRLGLLR